MIEELVDDSVESHTDAEFHPSEWDHRGIEEEIFRLFAFRPMLSPQEQENLSQDELREHITRRVKEIYEKRQEEFGEEISRNLEMFCSLQAIDLLWKEHLLSLDHLKEGIGLRGYAQRNPLHEYQKEGFELFQDLITRVKEETVSRLFRVRIAPAESLTEPPPPPAEEQLVMSHGEEPTAKKKTVRRSGKKVGRNEPCPCGSGKKYKKCCGR
jgi:preprotein translocase subunit SecA